MADTKLLDFTDDTDPTSDDKIYVVHDPGGTPANRDVTLGNLRKALGGIHDVWVGATGMWPSTTTGCAALAKREIVSGVDIQTLNFDGATDETAQFTIPLPRNFDNATITFHVYWTSATGTATI